MDTIGDSSDGMSMDLAVRRIAQHEEPVVVMADDEHFTETQAKVLSITSSVTAAVSLICASYMCYKCYQNRSRMFHRLMMGLSIHLLVVSIWRMYGTAAVPPSEYHNVWGARGTTATCSAQGFFLQVSFGVPCYYASLAVYSFQAVRFNFERKKYEWIEKYIHAAVNAWAFGSAIYLLAIEAFNPSLHGICWIHSMPFACEKDPTVECVRGPDNIETVAGVFAGIPTFIFILTATICMVCLVFFVKDRQSQIRINYKTVAKQAVVYLLGIYWTYLFSMINNSTQWIGGTTNFVVDLLSKINLNLMGLWMLLIYHYFYIPFNSSSSSPKRRRSSKASITDSAAFIASSPLSEDGAPSDPTAGKSPRNGAHGDHQSDHGTENGSSDDIYFNIFDGSNATGPFAQYVFDGDDEDKASDEKETQRWEDAQDHV